MDQAPVCRAHMYMRGSWRGAAGMLTRLSPRAMLVPPPTTRHASHPTMLCAAACCGAQRITSLERPVPKAPLPRFLHIHPSRGAALALHAPRAGDACTSAPARTDTAAPPALARSRPRARGAALPVLTACCRVSSPSASRLLHIVDVRKSARARASLRPAAGGGGGQAGGHMSLSPTFCYARGLQSLYHIQSPTVRPRSCCGRIRLPRCKVPLVGVQSAGGVHIGGSSSSSSSSSSCSSRAVRRARAPLVSTIEVEGGRKAGSGRPASWLVLGLGSSWQ